MSEGFPGYKGKALKVLKNAAAEIGDLIRVTNDVKTYEGILIPRSEYGDDKHIVIKIKSGYNLGIHVTR
ncbi:MAG: Glu-tRNA(Gln) amidotransferase GatDE subunit D, partial [Candidatus Bathyarchaeota archaeon]